MPAIDSPFEDFSPQGYRRFEAFLDDVYAGFKDRVTQGRKLDAAAVEASPRAASGRARMPRRTASSMCWGGLLIGDGGWQLGQASSRHSRDQRRDRKAVPAAAGYGEPVLARLIGREPIPAAMPACSRARLPPCVRWSPGSSG